MSKPNSPHLRLADDSAFQPSPEAYEKIRQLRRVVEAIDAGTPVDMAVHGEILKVAFRLNDERVIALTQLEISKANETGLAGEGIRRKLRNLFEVYQQQVDGGGD